MSYNPYLVWERKHVDNLNDIIPIFDADSPMTGAYDTETTGLHIIKDKPFLFQFGWLVPKKMGGKVFTFYPTQENMKVFFQLVKKLKFFVGQNVKYDLHMTTNIGYGEQVQELTNLVELMVVARLALEAKSVRDGGDSLALKKLGEKYVHPDAARSEKLIGEELTKLRGKQVKYLTAALKQFPYYNAKTRTGKPQMWNKGLIEKFLQDPTNDLEDLPEDVRDVWEEWQREFPEPTYEDVDRNLMIKYGAEDIITTLEYFKLAYPILVNRKQLEVLERENKAILPLYRMERVGIKVDREYLQESRTKVKNYIIQLRNEMYEIIGERVTCNQHERLKTIFRETFGIILPSSDKQAMKNVIKNYEGKPNRLATLINKLRTLEKWYSTYILRIIQNSEYDGRGYTQIFQANAVSGRVGSDFQQMPKDALMDLDGDILKKKMDNEKDGEKKNELKKEMKKHILFHPRKPFIPTGNGYDRIFYLDFSQVELRVAANYTILVSGGDLNLCRAYFPFKMTEEEAKQWKPTDIHAETTKKAYPDVPVGSEEFKRLRGSKGKPTNFLCLYGGTPPALSSTLEIEMKEAEALYNGYNQAFPHLQVYSKAVIQQHRQKGYVQNMYGRRYYLKDTRGAYKLGNYLIQGTCADDLKEVIIKIDELLLPYKSRFQMNIHDECSFEIWNGEEHLIPKLLEIMQHKRVWCHVPIISDVEVTSTNWSEKESYKV